MSDIIRTFIAVEIPENIVSQLRRLQNEMKTSGFRARWVRAEGIHLTLKFLGDIEISEVETVGRVITDLAKSHPSMTLSIRGVGVFPGIRRPRVLWAGISGETMPLASLQKALEARMEIIGFPKEARPFRGHLTLARFRKDGAPESIAAAVAAYGGFETESFAADAIHLFKSRLTPSGAEYTKLISAPLTG